MYIVQTCMYMFIQVYARFDSYTCTYLVQTCTSCTCLFHIFYLHSCMSRYVLLMFHVQMATYISRNVQKSLNCVHTLMYAFDFSFLFCPAGWPVGRDQLLPGVTPTQVQAHYQFNRHQPLVFLPPRPQPFWLGWGLIQQPQAQLQAPPRQRGRSHCSTSGGISRCLPGSGAAAAPPASSMLASSLGVVPASFLFFELALHDLGLGATSGALNPLDFRVILVGCQDCLQLRVCDLKESGFIWVYTSTIVLWC